MSLLSPEFCFNDITCNNDVFVIVGPRVGKQVLQDVEINAVTGALKLYFRELPEALFTDELYPALIEAYSESC